MEIRKTLQHTQLNSRNVENNAGKIINISEISTSFPSHIEADRLNVHIAAHVDYSEALYLAGPCLVVCSVGILSALQLK